MVTYKRHDGLMWTKIQERPLRMKTTPHLPAASGAEVTEGCAPAQSSHSAVVLSDGLDWTPWSAQDSVSGPGGSVPDFG